MVKGDVTTTCPSGKSPVFSGNGTMHASTSKLSCSLNPQKDMDESEMEGLSDAQTARVHQLNVTSLDKILKVLIRPMTDPWGLVYV